LALLTISLAVVVILAFYVWTFEKQAASMRGQVPPTPTEPTLTVLGEHFFDTIDGFRFKVPAQGWQIRVLSRPDSLPAEVPTRPILSNMVPIAVVSRDANGDTVAKVTVGLLRQTVPRNAADCAIQALGELIAQYERGASRVRLVKEVTTTGGGVHEGAYFMVVLPPEARHPLPVWVFSATVREGLSCVFLGQTTEAAYAEVRADIEKIVESFRWL
jgi:hypothetical protein